MSGGISSSERCEPNLVPILDMVFQLITFFMLVVNFKSTAVDHELVLPVLGSARPVDIQPGGELMVLNLRANGEVVVRGKTQSNFEEFIRLESELLASANELQPGEALPMRIVVRGDRSLTVQSLMRIVDLARANGFDQFDFVVTRPPVSRQVP